MYLFIPPYTLAGALCNRVRGGWLKHGLTPAEETALKATDIRRYGRIINITAFGLFAALASLNPVLGILAAGGMWLGQSLGWGRYIGAIAGDETEPLQEVPFIDAIIKPFRPDQVQNKRLTPRQQQIVWGFAGLSLRGLFWAMALALGPILLYGLGRIVNYFYGVHPFLLAPHVQIVAALPFLAAGACMGVVYATVIHTWKYNPLAARNPKGIAWEASELYYGAVLWGAFAVAFLQI